MNSPKAIAVFDTNILFYLALSIPPEFTLPNESTVHSEQPYLWGGFFSTLHQCGISSVVPEMVAHEFAGTLHDGTCTNDIFVKRVKPRKGCAVDSRDCPNLLRDSMKRLHLRIEPPVAQDASHPANFIRNVHKIFSRKRNFDSPANLDVTRRQEMMALQNARLTNFGKTPVNFGSIAAHQLIRFHKNTSDIPIFFITDSYLAASAAHTIREDLRVYDLSFCDVLSSFRQLRMLPRLGIAGSTRISLLLSALDQNFSSRYTEISGHLAFQNLLNQPPPDCSKSDDARVEAGDVRPALSARDRFQRKYSEFGLGK